MPADQADWGDLDPSSAALVGRLNAALAAEPSSEEATNARLADWCAKLEASMPLLGRAMSAETPAGLSEWILDATSDQIADNLVRNLDRALAPEAVRPELTRSLTALVSAHGDSADAGQAPEYGPAVAGRIGPDSASAGQALRLLGNWRVAAAIGIILLHVGGLALILSDGPTQPPQLTERDLEIRQLAMESRLARTMELMDRPMVLDRLDREAMMLMMEIETSVEDALVDRLFSPLEVFWQPGMEDWALLMVEDFDLF